MATADEPVDDDEVLYRRVPVSKGWYVQNATPPLSPEAFAPRPDELEGISLYRAKFKTLEAVSQGKARKGYYVAKLRAGELRTRGINICPDDPNDPAHLIVPDLNAHNCDSNPAREMELALAECVGNAVEGPFLPVPQPHPP